MLELVESNPLYASLIFDISAILIVLVFIIVNAKRGFSIIFISVVGYILAVIVGCVVGDSISEPIYDSVLKTQNVQSIEEVLDECNISQAIRDKIKSKTYGISISESKLEKIISSPDSVYNTINKDTDMFSKDEIVQMIAESISEEISEPLKAYFPSLAVDYMMNTIAFNSDKLYSTVSILLQDNKTSAEYIEETFIRPIVIYILKMAIFFITFFAVMVITKMIAKTIDNNNGSPTMANTTDSILGAIFGVIEAIILLILISIVLKLIVSSNANSNQILNDDVIQSTKIFKYIYNFDALKLID